MFASSSRVVVEIQLRRRRSCVNADMDEVSLSLATVRRLEVRLHRQSCVDVVYVESRHD